MAETVKVLGQVDLNATSLTDVYTVPADKAAVLSSVNICNRSASTVTFRVSVAVAGAANDNKQYLYYDTSLAANDTFVAAQGITLATTDVLRAYASTGDVTVDVFGVEVDV